MTVKTIKQNMRLSVISLTKQQCEKTITKMFFLNQFSLPLPYFDGRSTQHTNSETKQRRNTQLKVLKKITTQLGGGLLKINNSLSILVQPTQQISQRGDCFVFGLFFFLSPIAPPHGLNRPTPCALLWISVVANSNPDLAHDYKAWIQCFQVQQLNYLLQSELLRIYHQNGPNI